MSRIRELDPHVADLIAAGEVVERPASVIKELVENSVDAGAARIQVEIKRGGLALMRVSDDGEGIEADDLPTAFLRHATSKIATERDLENIASMGFRGEALASIAAVSKVKIHTRRRGSVEGAYYSIDGGVGGEVLPVGCPEGTSIAVEELFYNTPARQKFIKKDSAEQSRVVDMVTALALAHPEVAFKLICDGETTLSTRGGNLSGAVYDALGSTFAAGLLSVRSEQSGVKVAGFVSKPAYGHGNRRKQSFFVNRRPVSSRMLAAAVEQGYKNRMVQGRFPACVLHIELSPAVVDVNVHPAKSEVKFAFEREVFDAVYLAVCAALEQGDLRAEIGRAAPKFEPDLPGKQQEITTASGGALPKEVADFYRRMQKDAEQELTPEKILEMYKKGAGEIEFHSPEAVKKLDDGREVFEVGYTRRMNNVPTRRGVTVEMPLPERVEPKETSTERAEPTAVADVPRQPETAPKPTETVSELTVNTPKPPKTVAKPTAIEPKPAIASWRVLGEIFATYIVVEDGDELVLIDKHAAHERIIFDRLIAAGDKPLTQYLITPEIVQLGREDASAIREHVDELEGFGFEISDFGGESFAVRAIPSEIEREDIRGTLEELADSYISHKRLDRLQRREEIMSLVACKAAIKAGMHTTPEERRVLVERVMDYRDVRFCPHGRPVAAVLTRAELERRINRRV